MDVKVFLAGLAMIAAAVGAGVGYAGMKTAALPEWYDAPASEPEAAARPPAIETSRSSEPALASDAAAAAAIAPEDVTISAGELNQMVSDAIASQPQTAPILDAAKGINTSIADNRIESGVVVNIADIPTEALPAEGQQVVEQLTQTFPFLANRDVYLGIEGSPKVVDGALSLDDTHVKLGQLRLPVASVASQLGLSQSELEQQINALISQQGLTPSDVQIVDGQLVIRGLGS